jgi:hypothetical protein
VSPVRLAVGGVTDARNVVSPFVDPWNRPTIMSPAVAEVTSDPAALLRHSPRRDRFAFVDDQPEATAGHRREGVSMAGRPAWYPSRCSLRFRITPLDPILSK